MLRRNILFSAVAVVVLGAGAGVASLPVFLSAPGEPGLVVRVNLPAYELELWEGDELVERFSVTIGAPGYSTPTGEYAIDRIVWNPWWHPPDSRWASGSTKTPPGPRNPMGRVKMRFQGLLYIHGTASEGEIGHARSHGCIRMKNADALRLARLLAERSGQLERSELDRLEGDHRATREVALKQPVEVIISYRLVEERDGEVRSYDDVYGRGMRPHEREMLERAERESTSSNQ